MLDWNQEEIDAQNNYRPQDYVMPVSSPGLRSSGLFASPTSFDWRALSRVTDIKNQGSCGSCWSFSATAQYECLLAIGTNGVKYDLAEQYALECDTVSSGCGGGQPVEALKLIDRTGGIPL